MTDRIYAIADIHGRFDLLVRALQMIDRSPSGKIVITGDIVDRGPESKQVINLLMNREDIVVLKGNHEDMMLQALRTSDMGVIRHWLNNGGDATMKSFSEPFGATRDTSWKPEVVPSRVRAWLRNLPNYHETEHHVFVHAGVNPDVSMEDQMDSVLHWLRYPKYAYDGQRDFYDRPYKKHIVHGHCASATHPLLLHHRTNLDAYAWLTGRLAIGVFDHPGGPKEIFWAEGEPMWK